MKRMVWRGLVMAMGLVASGYLAFALRAAARPPGQSQSQQPLKGGVQQNENVPPVTDYFASGGDCNSKYMGLLQGPCSGLHAYIQAGGNDPTCLELLRKAIEVAQEATELGLQGAQPGGFPDGTYQKYISDQIEIQQLTNRFNGIAADGMVGRGCLQSIRRPSPGPTSNDQQFPVLQRIRPKTTVYPPTPILECTDKYFALFQQELQQDRALAVQLDGNTPQAEQRYATMAAEAEGAYEWNLQQYCEPMASQPPWFPTPAGNELRSGVLNGMGQCTWAIVTNPSQMGLMAVMLLSGQAEAAGLVNLGLVGVGLNGASRLMAAQSLVNMMNGQVTPVTSTNPYDQGTALGRDFCTWASAWMGVTTPSGGGGGETPGTGSASIPPDLGGLLSDTSWLKSINPMGSEMNCGSTALAVAKALLGQGVQRAASDLVCSEGTKMSLLEGEFGGKFLDYGNTAGINNAMYHAGNGAQGIIWVGNKEGSWGHYLNVVNYDNDIWLLDGQLGRLTSWQEVQGLMQMKGWTSSGLLRTN